MAKIKYIKTPDNTTYDIADASIATMGGNSSTTIENKQVISNYIASRGENLLTNGTALLGNNYNFSGLTYDGSDTYYAAGCFTKTNWASYGSFTNDEFIPVDVNQKYRFDFYTKTNVQGAELNGMITAYDIDKKQIISYQVAPRANTLTTLAQQLTRGDTKVYFTSIANFYTASFSAANAALLFYGYTNSFGYTYEPETYTQYRYTGLWSSISQLDFENNCITLTSAWTGPTFAAGTPVSQGQDGSGALYCKIDDINISRALNAGEWEHHWYHINGLQSKNNFPTSQFPFGTAYIKVGLMNRPTGAGQNFKISTMSFSMNALANNIPTVNNGTLTIKKNGSNVATFTANSSTNVTADISVPTAGSTASAVGTTASGGSATTFSKSDHIHNITDSTITSTLGYTPENTNNKVTAWQQTPDNTHYPSEKLVYDAIQDVTETAAGKTKSYVIHVSNEVGHEINPTFNNFGNILVVTNPIVDINNNTIPLSQFNVGDNIYIVETDIPDRWVASITTNNGSVVNIKCPKLETVKIPVTDVQVNNTSVVTNEIANIDLTPYAQSANLSTVATSGSYNDLSNKPTIPTNSDYVDLSTNQTIEGVKTFTSRPQYSESTMVVASDLASVATSGNYNDLTNLPTIPSDYIHSGSYNTAECRTGGLLIGATSVPSGMSVTNGRIYVTGVSNPLFGLKSSDSGAVQFFLQVTKDYLFVGPTSTKALSFKGDTGAVSLPNTLTVKSTTALEGNVTVGTSSTAADITAYGKFIKNGGTSAQFLKADGSVDSNSYALASSIPTVPTKTSDLTNDGHDGTHAFIDTEDIKYSNSNGTTMAVGGIAKGTTFSNKSVIDIIEDMLYPYVAFSFSSIATNAASGTFEYGTSKTITSVTPTFTQGSKNISSVKIGTTSGGNDLYNGTTATSGSGITISSVSLNGLSNYTVYCTLSDGTTTTTKSTTFTFSRYIYYGIKNNTTAPTSTTDLANMGSANSVSSGVSITTTDNTYIWFLSPTSKSTIQQFSMNQWNNIATTSAGTVSFTTSKNQTSTYYAYRSDKMVAATGTYRIN